MVPMDAIWLFSLLTLPLPSISWLHQPHSPPLQDCLWYWLCQENYLKLQAIWLAIHSPVGGQIDYEYPQNHGELLLGICFPSQGTILQIIKTDVFNIYICVWKPAVLKSSHIFYYVHNYTRTAMNTTFGYLDMLMNKYQTIC